MVGVPDGNGGEHVTEQIVHLRVRKKNDINASSVSMYAVVL